MVAVPTLNLVRETKICELMTCDQPTQRWEAGGVSVKDEYFFAVFDDRTEIDRFYGGLQLNETNWIFGLSHGDFGYEGIAYNAAKRRFFCDRSRSPHPSTGSRPQRYPHALANAQWRLARIQFDYAFQRARVVILQGFGHDRTALRVPIGDADHVARPAALTVAVIPNRGGLTGRQAAGELLFHLRANDTPATRTEDRGRLFRLRSHDVARAD